MMTLVRGVALLAAMTLGVAVRAADASGGTARVRLIAGQAAEKAYLPRLKAVRELDSGTPLSDGERTALLAFLRRTDGADGTEEMELAAIKNDVAEHLLRLPDMPGAFARDLLEMQADPAQSPTWRDSNAEHRTPNIEMEQLDHVSKTLRRLHLVPHFVGYAYPNCLVVAPQGVAD